MLLTVLLGVAATVSPVSGADVLRACGKVRVCVLDETLTAQTKQRVGTFCSAVADPVASGPRWEPTPDYWERWSQVTLPSPDEIRSTANCKAGGGATALGTRPTAPAPSTGFDESALVWGAADFLVQSARRELQDWFLARFHDSFCVDHWGKGVPGGNIWFAGTCKELERIDLLELARDPKRLQDRTRADLSALPGRVATNVVRPAIAVERDPARKDLLVTADFSAEVAQAVLDGAAPLQALRSMAVSSDLGVTCSRTPVAFGLYEASAVLNAYPVVSSNGTIVVQVPMDPPGRIYAALAAAVNLNAVPTWPTCDTDSVTSRVHLDPRLAYRTALSMERPIATLVQASEDLRRLPAGVDDQTRLRAFSAVIAKAFGLMEAVVTAGDHPAEEERQILGALRDCAVALGQGRPSELAADLDELISELRVKDAIPPDLLRVVAFGGRLSAAKTPDDVNAAFQAFAAPPGSYKRKRETGGWYGLVTGYVGATGGAEKSVGVWAPTYGMTAPIGVEIGHGYRGTSVGLLLQAVDLGTLTWWRAKQGSGDVAAERPEVGVQQVFAPGAYLVVGLKRAPITVGVGAAAVPALRAIDPSTSGATPISCNQCDAVHLGAFVAIDVPLFP